MCRKPYAIAATIALLLGLVMVSLQAPLSVAAADGDDAASTQAAEPQEGTGTEGAESEEPADTEGETTPQDDQSTNDKSVGTDVADTEGDAAAAADASADVSTQALEENSLDVVYVSADSSDETGDGSQENPVASLSKAVDLAEDGGTVYVMSDITMT